LTVSPDVVLQLVMGGIVVIHSTVTRNGRAILFYSLEGKLKQDQIDSVFGKEIQRRLLPAFLFSCG
jgi:hypothetical protein